MKILEWEKNISKKFTYEKITEISELKDFLVNHESYSYNFSPSEISEGNISDDGFYAAYVFDERQILQKEVVPYSGSGWTTTIVLIESKNKIDLDDYFILGLNGFSQDDVKKFLNDNFYTDKISKGLNHE